eukprot:1660759-Amphidinium_carterae.2
MPPELKWHGGLQRQSAAQNGQNFSTLMLPCAQTVSRPIAAQLKHRFITEHQRQSGCHQNALGHGAEAAA